MKGSLHVLNLFAHLVDGRFQVKPDLGQAGVLCL
jgi:hypothetical protein